MRVPEFPEANHPLLDSLKTQRDSELLRQFQDYPDQGKFFAAIFYRYYPIVYGLILQNLVTPEVTNYLLALVWRQFFYEMRGLVFEDLPLDSLQDWLIYHTGAFLREVSVPEMITYDLETTPPPLWCYVEQGLENLDPLSRFILVMSEKFNWNQTRIIAYLQAEGQTISLEEVNHYLEQGYTDLQASLPADIRAIYLESYG
ncbi:MAG: sigma-70 family RNA polymerase sigma factor [Gloeocapsa sp. DLM2.Bin57]|nr:MAG: sigma-70 family RNA polymerase sigma factor [Gloeocapsa sp. DLM2.Bin57]